MKYSNELKVGIAVIVSLLILFFGIRYFQDVPLFSGSYELQTAFADANGLVNGNPVRINGVPVGAVDEIRLNTEAQRVEVLFHVENGLVIPEGSTTRLSGLAAFGTVMLDITLGPSGNPAIPEGGFVPSASADGLDQIISQAPELVGRADTLLLGATAALNEVEVMLSNPQSDLRQMLVAIEASATSLERLLRLEQRRLGSALESVDTLATTLSSFTTQNQDSLAQVIANLNSTLAQVNGNLAALETTTANLDLMLTKINQGEGTLGLLVNDPRLYNRLDSTAASLNALLLDIQRNPKRYLEDLRLVDVF